MAEEHNVDDLALPGGYVHSFRHHCHGHHTNLLHLQAGRGRSILYRMGLHHSGLHSPDRASCPSTHQRKSDKDSSSQWYQGQSNGREND